MAKGKNKNIQILSSLADLKNEVLYTSFQYKEHFHHLCDLKPNKKLEQLEIVEVAGGDIKRSGLVYVMVINNKIFKIGHTITSIKKRIQSYNCGKVEYRIAGTNGTTNYFILQSLLKINKKVQVYAFFPKHPKYEIFGEKYQDSYPAAKTAEKKIIQDFMEQHNKKPIGCTTT